MTTAEQSFFLEPVDHERLAALCGNCNEHLHQLEQHFGVAINNRGNHFHITGHENAIKQTEIVLNYLYSLTEEDLSLTPGGIHLAIKENSEKYGHANQEAMTVIKTPGLSVKVRSQSQRQYVDAIQHHAITFGIGPAGTGKTFLAVACAVQALEAKMVQRIILARPAVEAGERLGFLPGDLSQKVDPYLRPLYDALYEMYDAEKVNRLVQHNVIEIAPLAYMRGRTLNDSFIILDESQNTTKEQMKMFLTRIGFGSTAVITGDVSQIDLPRGSISGLQHACQVLQHVDGIPFCHFDSSDVVRHPMVQHIIDAYHRHEDRRK